MNLRYFKNIIPAAVLVVAGLSSCTGDLDVTPIDPSSTMVPDEAALFTKCYSNMALQGQGGQGGDCDIDGLDGGTAGFVRQLFNSNELTTDEAICAWGDPGIPAFNYNQYDASHPCSRDSTTDSTQALLIATTILRYAPAQMPHAKQRCVFSVPCTTIT